MMRNYLLQLLKEGPLHIEFTKSDGTVRKMRCSLKDDLVSKYEKKTERTKEPNTSTQSVYDLDKQQWRSFRWENLISFNKA